jgi:hypothetical protein
MMTRGRARARRGALDANTLSLMVFPRARGLRKPYISCVDGDMYGGSGSCSIGQPDNRVRLFARTLQHMAAVVRMCCGSNFLKRKCPKACV